MKNCLAVLALSVTFSVIAIPANAQATPSSENGKVRVYVDLLTLRTTVVTNKGRVVSDLSRKNFRGWACPTTTGPGKLSNPKRKEVNDCLVLDFQNFDYENVPPVRAFVAIDTSGSTKPYLDDLSKKASVWFFEKILLKESDLGAIMEFAERARLVVGWTRNIEEISEGQKSLRSEGLSAITDTLFTVASTVMTDKQITGFTKIAVIVTDGLDNFRLPLVKDGEDGVKFCSPEERVAGQPTPCRIVQDEDLALAVQKGDFLLFVVNLSKKYGTDRLASSYQKPEDLAAKLKAVATSTGGEHFWVNNVGDAHEALEEIAARIGKIYILGSYVQTAKPGWYDIYIEVGEWDENGRFTIFKKYRPEYPRRWYLDPRKKK